MKYLIFLKNNKLIEYETLEQCNNCIDTMLKAVGNNYNRLDFKIYAEVTNGLDRLEHLENLQAAYNLDIETSKEIINDLKAENKKLKAAIKLLKDAFNIKILVDLKGKVGVSVETGILSVEWRELNEQENELLKEVLNGNI